MYRRYLPALDDHRRRRGAWATSWEGWVNPRDRALVRTYRKNACHPESVYDWDAGGIGCYSILYTTSGGSRYCAYIGVAQDVRDVLLNKIRIWKLEHGPFLVTARYIGSTKRARAYEDDLIRYYCPTWNTLFNIQRRG